MYIYIYIYVYIYIWSILFVENACARLFGGDTGQCCVRPATVLRHWCLYWNVVVWELSLSPVRTCLRVSKPSIVVFALNAQMWEELLYKLVRSMHVNAPEYSFRLKTQGFGERVQGMRQYGNGIAMQGTWGPGSCRSACRRTKNRTTMFRSPARGKLQCFRILHDVVSSAAAACLQIRFW